MATDTVSAGSSQTKLPYTEVLTWDSTLNINNEDFVKVLKEGTKLEERSQERQLDSVVALPEPKVFAHFASKAYQKKKDDETREKFEERLQLPAGWKLLTTANNLAFLRTIKGYFGAVFWHPIRRRIVIAHRGTDPTNLNALRADLNGILRNRYVRQMRAACTLTHRIFEAVKECEEERRTHFEIYFTGHSLGAWLAQVTTFCLEYLTLEKETETFLKNPNPEGGRHAHAEVFDSPGSSETLRQMASDFDVRYSGKSSHLDHLDITVYLSSPNFVNCCNTHVGRLYRVYPKIESSDYVKYTLSSHSMDGILKLFNSSNPFVIIEVVDWPTLDPTILQWKLWKIHKSLLGKEYEDFFEWAKDLNYDPKPEDITLKVAASNDKKSPWFYFKKYLLKRETDADNDVKEDFVTIRYQTKPVRANQCNPSVFVESELRFLRNFQQLQILPNSIFDGDENKNKTIEKLRQLTLDDKSVICDGKADIRQLIPYVKTLLRLYPDLNERVELALTDFEVRKKIYRDITDRYRDRMKGLIEMLQKPDWPQLDGFLESENQVCRILAKIGTDFAAAKALKTINAIKHEGFTVFAFELQTLLSCETFFHLTEFLNSDKLNRTLILLECKSGSLSSSGNVQFVQGVLDRIRERPNLKLISITDENKTFTSNNDLESIIDEGITWGELTNEAKNMIVKKEVIVFQGDDRNKRSLEKLLRLTSTEMDLNHLADIVDAETLARFLRDEDVMVAKSLTKPEDVYVNREFTNKPYLKENVFRRAMKLNNVIMAISGLSKDDIRKDDSKAMLFGICESIIKLIKSDEDFETLCSNNSKKNVHWLKYESNSFVFHKSRGTLGHIRKYIVDKVEKYSEETLLEKDRKTVIISAVPGMGKTTVLSVLAQKIKLKHPDHWVVRVNLNDCAEALRTATSIETISDAARFLSEQILPCCKDTKLNSDFEKRLFEQDLMIGGGVVLMFDGFDEISPDYQGTAIRLLKLLQRTRVDHLVVTTKPHTKEKLEDGLSTLSHAMVPFSKDNYEALLLEIWKKRYVGTDAENELDESEDFLREFTKNVDQSFLGIPLHCALLAELKPGELEVLPLFDLYEGFIRRKINIYSKENPIADGSMKIAIESIQKMHWKYAFTLIPLDYDLDYDEMTEESNKTIENEVLKMGLMVNNGSSPQFLHRTFAEFFMLEYALNLAENIEKNSNRLTVLSRVILLEIEFSVIRSFLESLIKNDKRKSETKNIIRRCVVFCSRNFSTSPAILHLLLDEHLYSTFTLFLNTIDEQCRDKMATFLSNTRHDGTVLHIAVKIGNLNIVQLILSRIKTPNETRSRRATVADKYSPQKRPLQKDKRADIFDARDSEGWTALQLASHLAQTRAASEIFITIIRLLLEKGADINAKYNDGSTPLINASRVGHLEIVSLLLKNEADINAIDVDGSTPLGEASLGGHLEIFRLLLENGADINASDKYGSTPLIKASSGGHLEIVTRLLGKSADINANDNDGSTPLGEASLGGHLEIVRFLLREGADVNASDKYGSTPLIKASSGGHLEIVTRLLGKSADINANDNDGSTPLGEASLGGHLEIVKILLKSGARINASANDESTPFEKRSKINTNNKRVSNAPPILKASSAGHLEVVRFLIENGADINARDKVRSTSLIIASRNGYLEVVELLLEKGADINASDNGGSTPLIEASCNGRLEVVELLLGKGADINASDNDGSTPIKEASSGGHLNVVSLLLGNGANINDKRNGSSPLIEASGKGHLEVVRLLLEKKADINARDNRGSTPLIEASYKGHLKVVRLLIEKNADINARDNDGSTALRKASYFEKRDIVSFLLEKGANINVGDNHGSTPLMIASSAGHLEIVRLLLEKKADINARDKRRSTSLIEASSAGHLEIDNITDKDGLTQDLSANVRLMSNRVSVNSLDTLRRLSALHYASDNGHTDVVVLLLDNQADVNIRGRNNCTPLHLASKWGHLETVRVLLKRGANPVAKIRFNKTPLQLAIKNKRTEIIELLSQHERNLASARRKIDLCFIAKKSQSD